VPVRIGCSGWSYAHWRKPVYGGAPSGRWLGLYAEHFPTVEVNASFYRLPTLRMARGWAERSPEGFVFAVKMSRYVTHIRRLRDVPVNVGKLIRRIEPLAEAGKLGPLLWQLPETFPRDDERLAAALRALPDGRNCFEFRHPSWFCPEVREMLAGAGAALVVGDRPERRFQTLEPTADWAYVRFHYGSRGRRGNYSDAELHEWAERIRGWARRGDVYAYFNNDWEAFAVRNAERLWALVGGPEEAGAAPS
jgi:uncharacterized protein YecE (DUF72 family)